MSINRRSTHVWTSWPLLVSPALSALDLQPGQRKIYSLNGSFTDRAGDVIPPGSYRLSVFLLKRGAPKVVLSIALE